MDRNYFAEKSQLLFTSSVGDKAHFATLVLTSAFCAMVISTSTLASAADNTEKNSSKRHSAFFDESWLEYGFCVKNVDQPYWTSHDVCLYYDFVMSMVLGILYLMLHKTPGMEKANKLCLTNIPGTLVHGVVHGYAGYALREGILSNPEETLWQIMAEQYTSFAASFLEFLPILLFYVVMIRASATNIKLPFAIVGGIVAAISSLAVPMNVSFTYTQTILFMVFSLDQLARPVAEKDFHYMLFPLVVGFPLALMSWLESTQCDAFVRDRLYGHLIYDGYIGFSTPLWYIMCYGKMQSQPSLQDRKIKTQ